VADAIGALEVEKVVGPSDLVNVHLSYFWSRAGELVTSPKVKPSLQVPDSIADCP
jgi:hypothetical protein